MTIAAEELSVAVVVEELSVAQLQSCVNYWRQVLARSASDDKNSMACELARRCIENLRARLPQDDNKEKIE